VQPRTPRAIGPADPIAGRTWPNALLGLGLAIAAGRLPVAALGLVPPCPLRALIGLLCPLCGATHALYHLARGEWVAAWHSNALVPPAVGLLTIRALLGDAPRLGLRGRRVATAAGVGLVAGFTVARNLAGVGVLLGAFARGF